MNNKNNGFSLIWVLGIVIIVSIISGLTTGVIVYNNNKLSNKVTYADLSNDEELNQFLEVYANITSEYYEDVNKKELLEKAIAAMMNYLGDDYTTYLDGENTNELFSKLSGEYTGIGIAINNDNKTITKVYDDTPASKVDIKEGDIIVGFNEQDVSNLTVTEIVSFIKGTNNYFILKLKRGEEIITVKLKNEKIIQPCIDYKIIDETSKIGYIYIETFSKTLGVQIEKALKELEASGMKSLIIDVRENTGGYLEAASEIANMFIKKGEKIYSLNYKNTVNHYLDETNEYKDYNVVVLINGNSASASEILAASLKESYGAKLVGEKTFGKGKVQQTMELEDGSMIKYTSAYWLTPNGTCIDGVGISPDYIISNENKVDETGNIIEIIDKQLEKAINILR